MLQYAQELILASETRSGINFLFTEEASRIKRSLAEAVKDNDFIYHAMVPERSALAPLGKLTIAKPLPYSPTLSSNFRGEWFVLLLLVFLVQWLFSVLFATCFICFLISCFTVLLVYMLYIVLFVQCSLHVMFFFFASFSICTLSVVS